MDDDDAVTTIVVNNASPTNVVVAKSKEMTSKANLRQGNSHQKRYDNKSDGKKSNAYQPKSNNFKKGGNCFVCGKPDHHAPQYSS